jgi:acetoacetyl-CoA synthetase
MPHTDTAYKLWQPTQESIAQTQLHQFIQFVEKKFSLTFKNYTDFYEWSIQFIGDFWESVWLFCNIVSHSSYETPFIEGKTMQDAQWFPGATLNFAENLLRHCKNSKKTAIIAHDESGRRREISGSKLYAQVAALADALKKHGVQKHDRVAGYLPNIPETIIAMLATTSIGAIWSSCSPDFGVEGIIDRFDQIQPKILFITDGQFYNGKAHDLLDKASEIIKKVSSVQKTIVIPFISEIPPLNHLKNSSLYENFLTKQTEIHFEPLPFNHPLVILYSSGTTGKPKGIVHGAGGTLIQHLKELVLHTDLTQKDTFLYYTTCGWMMWNWMVSGLATGSTLVLFDGSPGWPHTGALFDIIEQENVTVFGTSAKYIATVQKEHLDLKNTHNLSALRCILSTGSPLNPDNFDYVYEYIKADLQLSSISGGTDIISCFGLGNPILPVYRGQLQCRGLGLAVEIYNEEGQSIREEKGELVCTKPFPCMPVMFWSDPDGEKYHAAYFEKFTKANLSYSLARSQSLACQRGVSEADEGVYNKYITEVDAASNEAEKPMAKSEIWAHGDYAEITKEDGMIIYGRSDAILNPGGVRIGTAEIYRQVEKIDAILESVVVGQEWDEDVRVVLFVKLRPEIKLDEALEKTIRKTIRDNTSPRHVPAKICQVNDIPRTLNGKIAELAVRNAIHHQEIKNQKSLANPECLKEYETMVL